MTWSQAGEAELSKELLDNDVTELLSEVAGGCAFKCGNDGAQK